MSVSSKRSTISKIRKDISDLQKKLSDEVRKKTQLQQEIIQLQESIDKNISPDTITLKLNQIARHNSDVARHLEKKDEILKKIASKNIDLQRYELQLSQDEENERKKQDLEINKRAEEKIEFEKILTREEEARNRAVHTQLALSKQALDNEIHDVNTSLQHDVFISHVREDKDDFVRPFARYLKSLGISVWYDEFTLQGDDSLIKKIDRGLANAKFGILVISREFVNKDWAEYEVNDLLAKDINGTGRILPIWHNITKSEVINFSTSLADKMALTTAHNTIPELAKKLLPILIE
ncbi:TPA: toll/interleukin-1 receptor domain-containing protein [Morganella morganii]